MPLVTTPTTRCRIGVAERDITPPVGIYHRTWGAAAHDQAEGVHRPLTATAVVFAGLDSDTRLALVAVDIGWFQNLEDEWAVRRAVLEHARLDESALLINMSHTHAGPNVNSKLADLPGGEYIEPYLRLLGERIGEAVVTAQESLTPGWVTWGWGRCDLAGNRDFWDAEAGAWACGFNSTRRADDTLLVGRVSDDNGETRAILFNYACHPTTLAWENRLLSPDFVGAAREVLERAFGAPALFLQGASGDLGPREGFVGDAAVADRNGRQLGYAVASAVEALPPAGTAFVYTGIKPSGADLGTWAHRPASAAELAGADTLEARLLHVDVPRKAFPPVPALEAELAACQDRRQQEILRRRLFIQQTLGPGETHAMPLWVWRLGQAGVVAIPNEPYSVAQAALRERFAGLPLVVMGVTNGTLGYLCPADTYGQGIYQEVQSPYAPGCLEMTIDAAAHGVADLWRVANG